MLVEIGSTGGPFSRTTAQPGATNTMLFVSELIDKRWHDLTVHPFVGEKCALQLCEMFGECADNKSGRSGLQ